MYDKLREDISQIVYDLLGGDNAFDKEGGYYPCADLADEKADEILSLLLKREKELLMAEGYMEMAKEAVRVDTLGEVEDIELKEETC